MINAQELRIGNWVSNGEKQFTIDISSLYDIGAGITDKIIEPILLTPKILELCNFFIEEEGFEDEYRELTLSCGITLCETNKNGITEVIILEYDKVILKYLHQLQNFVYSIEGKELIYNNLKDKL